MPPSTLGWGEEGRGREEEVRGRDEHWERESRWRRGMEKLCLKFEVFVIHLLIWFLLPDSCHTDTQISIPKSISEMKQLIENTGVQSHLVQQSSYNWTKSSL